MATFGNFADLSRYIQAANQPVVDPLTALAQGFTQGQALRNLPQTLQEQRDMQLLNQLQKQLTVQTMQQKLSDLQNPDAALARQVREQLTLKGALNPDLGIVQAPVGLAGEVIQTPGALTADQMGLLQARTTAAEQGGVPFIQPTAVAGPEITPIGLGGIQTGLNINPAISAAAKTAKNAAKIAEIEARAAALGTPGKAFTDSEGNVQFIPTRSFGGVVPTATPIQSAGGEGLKAPKKTSKGGLTAGQQANYRLRGARAMVDINQFTDPETGAVDWDSFINKTGEAEGSVLNANNVIKAARAAAVSNKTTLDEKNFQVYGNRMDQANNIFDVLEKKGFDPTSLGVEGMVGGWSPNLFKTDDRQDFEQAERNFINATLRRESGAVITDQEFANARQQYLPQPGDGESVLIQKAANRKLVVDEFKRLGGQYPPSAQQSSPAATVGGQSSQGKKLSTGLIIKRVSP